MNFDRKNNMILSGLLVVISMKSHHSARLSFFFPQILRKLRVILLSLPDILHKYLSQVITGNITEGHKDVKHHFTGRDRETEYSWFPVTAFQIISNGTNGFPLEFW